MRALSSPLGPFSDGTSMSSFKSGSLHDAVNSVSSYCRHDDGIVVILSERKAFDALLNYFNRAHPSIHSTIRLNTGNSLTSSYLHLCRRSDRSLRRSVYRKPTETGHCARFRSSNLHRANRFRKHLRCLGVGCLTVSQPPCNHGCTLAVAGLAQCW